MSLIDRYVARNFLSGAAIVLLVLLPLFAFLTLSEELENTGKGVYTSFDAVIVVAYSLPALMLDLLPVTALLGVLIGLGAMANHHELIIINAVGYSARRIALPIVEVVAVLIAIVLLLQFIVIPSFELNAARVRAKATSLTAQMTNDSELWTRSENRFIRIGKMTRQGAMLDVEIFDLGEDGQTQELTRAARIDILGEDKWLLQDVTNTDFRSADVREEHIDRSVWKSLWSAQQTAALIAPIESKSPAALYRYIQLLEQNDLDTHRYRVILWQQLSIPIGLLAMALLGFPFVMGSVRSMPAGQRAAIGGSFGILFYLAEQMMGHLALLYELSPAPAAFGPDVALLVAALVNLHRAR
jgi:lipopolysaccharide export system permease protein